MQRDGHQRSKLYSDNRICSEQIGGQKEVTETTESLEDLTKSIQKIRGIDKNHVHDFKNTFGFLWDCYCGKSVIWVPYIGDHDCPRCGVLVPGGQFHYCEKTISQ